MVLTPFLIAQALGVVAIVTDAISMHVKKREAILIWLIISSVLIATHFVLMEEYVPAALIYTGAVRLCISIFTTDKRVLYFFVGLNVISSYILFEHWYSIFAFLGSMGVIISSFQTDEKLLRKILMVGTSFWIIHHIFAASPAAIVLDSLFLVNNIWGYYRYYGKKSVTPVDV